MSSSNIHTIIWQLFKSLSAKYVKYSNILNITWVYRYLLYFCMSVCGTCRILQHFPLFFFSRREMNSLFLPLCLPSSPLSIFPTSFIPDEGSNWVIFSHWLSAMTQVSVDIWGPSHVFLHQLLFTNPYPYSFLLLLISSPFFVLFLVEMNTDTEV